MSFVPPLYKDFGKKFNDLITKKFKFENRVAVKTKNADGLTVETGGVGATVTDLNGFLKATYKNASFGQVEAELKTEGKANVEVKAEKLVDNATFIVSAKEKPLARLEAQYRRDSVSASVTADVESRDKAKVGATAVVGFDGLSVGGAAAVSQSGSLVDYNAAVEYTQNDFTATVKTEQRAEKVVLSYLHVVDPKLQIGASFGYNLTDSTRLLTVASQYTIDDSTLLQTRIESSGVFTAAYEHVFKNPSFKLLAVGSQNIKSVDSRRFGLALQFGETD